jgi:hypothetical protein
MHPKYWNSSEYNLKDVKETDIVYLINWRYTNKHSQ